MVLERRVHRSCDRVGEWSTGFRRSHRRRAPPSSDGSGCAGYRPVTGHACGRVLWDGGRMVESLIRIVPVRGSYDGTATRAMSSVVPGSLPREVLGGTRAVAVLRVRPTWISSVPRGGAT
jgi:hypothetical protein